jgi:hypothetical protein
MTMNKLSRILLVIGTFSVLFTARAAHAGPFGSWVSGYPCTVTYKSQGNGGDKMTVNLYTQPYCAGSYVGYAEFYGLTSTGAAQSCVQAGISIPATTMPALHQRITDNYWRSMSIYTELSSAVCNGTNYSAATQLQITFN